MEQFVKLNNIVAGYTVTDQYIDCIAGTEIIKIEKSSGNVIHTKVIFEKEGFSRKIMSHNGQIFIYDFCTLYVLNQENFELIYKSQLGTDLSSDICGMMVNEDTIYCSMRNGGIITVDRKSYATNEYKISDSSMWSLIAYKSYLVCGTVDGKVLLLDQTTLSLEKEIILGKQNVSSLYIDHDILYAASQDKKLHKIDLLDFHVITVKKNAHNKMFKCIGLYNDMLATVSYPCSEISLWDKDTLENKKVFSMPLKLDGCTYLKGDYLYITSRNMLGINRLRLEK